MAVALSPTAPKALTETPPAELAPEAIRNSLILEVVKYCLIDAAIKIAFAVAVSCFVATPMNFVGFAFATGIAIGVTVVCRSFRAFLEYEERLKRERLEGKQILTTCSNHMEASIFGAFYDLTAGTLIHEAGHAIAADLLFVNPHPEITILPIEEGGAFTSYHPTAFNAHGASRYLVSGAGSLLAVTTATAFLVAAFWMKDSHPAVSRALAWSGIFQILHHVTYALSALWDTTMSGHDFANLWVAGLHPIVSALIVVAIPAVALLISYGIKAVLSRCDRAEDPVAEPPTMPPPGRSAVVAHL